LQFIEPKGTEAVTGHVWKGSWKLCIFNSSTYLSTLQADCHLIDRKTKLCTAEIAVVNVLQTKCAHLQTTPKLGQLVWLMHRISHSGGFNGGPAYVLLLELYIEVFNV